jgi:hypothetical protein
MTAQGAGDAVSVQGALRPELYQTEKGEPGIGPQGCRGPYPGLSSTAK